MSNKGYANPFRILMNGQALSHKDSFVNVGVDIFTSSSIVIGHVIDLAVAAGKKLGCLCRTLKYFSDNNSINLATLYELKYDRGQSAVLIFGVLYHQLHSRYLAQLKKNRYSLIDDYNITRHQKRGRKKRKISI